MGNSIISGNMDVNRFLWFEKVPRVPEGRAKLTYIIYRKKYEKYPPGQGCFELFSPKNGNITIVRSKSHYMPGPK